MPPEPSPPPAAGASSPELVEDAVALELALRPVVDASVSAGEQLEERVSPVHLRALQSLESAGPCHVSVLAEDLGLLPSTASRLSDRLAAAGLITRGASPANRRATLLDLTPAGREILADLARARAERLSRVLAVMSDRDRRRLLAAARSLADAASRVGAQGTPTTRSAISAGD
ncbi:MarR family transcriptional regulator [Actinomycetospora sp. CA-084318]|uniref:MarR family transcriptional regulator n=1 Tax=Actinomycetospora sp. CA-084318 TaxID=3239892 RepID=UPI003D98BE73